MFLYRQGNFVLKTLCREPSLFLLIHDRNNHPEQSLKITLQSVKSQLRFKSGTCFGLLDGNPDVSKLPVRDFIDNINLYYFILNDNL